MSHVHRLLFDKCANVARGIFYRRVVGLKENHDVLRQMNLPNPRDDYTHRYMDSRVSKRDRYVKKKAGTFAAHANVSASRRPYLY